MKICITKICLLYRTSGVKLDFSALMSQKDRSSKDLDQNRVLVDRRQSETAKIVETKRQTLLNPSLKRKMIEVYFCARFYLSSTFSRTRIMLLFFLRLNCSKLFYDLIHFHCNMLSRFLMQMQC